jgi:hypothetical protein
MKVFPLTCFTLLALALSGCDSDRPLTFEECRELGGDAYTDPGNGSLTSCPVGMRQLGLLSEAFEGGLCCEK